MRVYMSSPAASASGKVVALRGFVRSICGIASTHCSDGAPPPARAGLHLGTAWPAPARTPWPARRPASACTQPSGGSTAEPGPHLRRPAAPAALLAVPSATQKTAPLLAPHPVTSTLTGFAGAAPTMLPTRRSRRWSKPAAVQERWKPRWIMGALLGGAGQRSAQGRRPASLPWHPCRAHARAAAGSRQLWGPMACTVLAPVTPPCWQGGRAPARSSRAQQRAAHARGPSRSPRLQVGPHVGQAARVARCREERR